MGICWSGLLVAWTHNGLYCCRFVGVLCFLEACSYCRVVIESMWASGSVGIVALFHLRWMSVAWIFGLIFGWGCLLVTLKVSDVR